jgi:hypothetical protein
MKSVTDLDENELEELKWSYFYDEPNDFDYPHEIPNEILFEHFGHISFVEEDFSSNI